MDLERRELKKPKTIWRPYALIACGSSFAGSATLRKDCPFLLTNLKTVGTKIVLAIFILISGVLCILKTPRNVSGLLRARLTIHIDDSSLPVPTRQPDLAITRDYSMMGRCDSVFRRGFCGLSIRDSHGGLTVYSCWYPRSRNHSAFTRLSNSILSRYTALVAFASHNFFFHNCAFLVRCCWIWSQLPFHRTRRGWRPRIPLA